MPGKKPYRDLASENTGVSTILSIWIVACTFCFLILDHVMFLQKTVSFKRLLIHVRMYVLGFNVILGLNFVLLCLRVC